MSLSFKPARLILLLLCLFLSLGCHWTKPLARDDPAGSSDALTVAQPLALNGCALVLDWPAVWSAHHGIEKKWGETPEAFRLIETQLATKAVESGGELLGLGPNDPQAIIPRHECNSQAGQGGSKRLQIGVEYVAGGTFFKQGQQDSLIIATLATCPYYEAGNRGTSYYSLNEQGQIKRLSVPGLGLSAGYYNVGDVNDDERDDVLFVEMSSYGPNPDYGRLLSFSDTRKPLEIWSAMLANTAHKMSEKNHPDVSSKCTTIDQPGPGEPITVSTYRKLTHTNLTVQ
jgi:hypothetical protein